MHKNGILKITIQVNWHKSHDDDDTKRYSCGPFNDESGNKKICWINMKNCDKSKIKKYW